MNGKLKAAFGILGVSAVMLFSRGVAAAEKPGKLQTEPTKISVELNQVAGSDNVVVDGSPVREDNVSEHEVKKASGGQEEYTRKAAYRASTDQIVLHYGEGVEDVPIFASVLIKRGYPTVALPGGAEGKIELFIGRGKFGTYDQRDLDDGTLGGNAMDFYDRKLGKENYTRKAAYRASTDQIVLHYDSEIMFVDVLAEGLSEQGFSSIAVPGGPKGQIEMFVGRKMAGKYTEDDLADGTLGGDAVRLYNEHIRGVRPTYSE